MMKLYPYTQINTENLKGLLILSRVMGLVSYLLFTASIALSLWALYVELGGSNTEVGHDFIISVSPSPIPILYTLASALCIAVSLLVISSICAALVSWEHKISKE